MPSTMLMFAEWRDGKGNTFRRVSFASANLSRSTTSAAVYEDCDFSFAKLDRVNFWQSSLIGCTFAGPVRDVVFDGRMLGEGKPTSNPRRDVDLSQAVLDGCEFRGLTFDSMILPTDPDLIRISDTAAIDAAAAAHASGLARVILDHARTVLAMGGECLLNLRDLGPAADAVRAGLLPSRW
jgi:uncharacterized protein YjbI with pentapeptide repeats